MTDHLSNAADDSEGSNPDVTPDAAPKAKSKPKARAAKTPAATSPEMAHPTAMDYQAGFTSGR